MLGAIFCFTLVGAPPWRPHQREQAPVSIGGKRLPVSRVALGLLLLVFGGLWMVSGAYLFAAYGRTFERFNAHYFQLLGAFPIGLFLILSGIAVLRRWRRWRAAYVTSVALLGFTVLGSFGFPPMTDPGSQIFQHVLPLTSFAVVGGIAMFIHLAERSFEIENRRTPKPLHG